MVPERERISYARLAHSIWMASTFWDIQRKVIPSRTISDHPVDMGDMTWHKIFPYLTQKRRNKQEQIDAFLPNQ